MAHVREQILERLADTLNPLFPGGCQRFLQRGQPVAVKLPRAIVRWVGDNAIGSTTSDESDSGRVDGTSAQGWLERELLVTVDVYLVDPDWDIQKAINREEWSDSKANEQLVIVHKALMADVHVGGLAQNGLSFLSEKMSESVEGNPLYGASWTCKVLYGHLERDPESQ